MAKSQPGDLVLQISIEMVIEQGLSTTLFEREMVLPRNKIAVTSKEMGRLGDLSPAILKMLTDSGIRREPTAGRR